MKFYKIIITNFYQSAKKTAVARFPTDGENGIKPDTKTQAKNKNQNLPQEKISRSVLFDNGSEPKSKGTEIFMTAKFTNPLNDIRIASPCSQDWDAMIGDNRRRFCCECKLNVFNLSGMTPSEAENLISNAEGRLCVRFYKRADGSVITEDCPVGWARVKRRVKIFATAAFSLIVSLFSGLLFVSLFSKQKDFGRIFPIPFIKPTPEKTMGIIARPTPKNSPTPKPSPMPKATPKPEREMLIGKAVVPKNSMQ